MLLKNLGFAVVLFTALLADAVPIKERKSNSTDVLPPIIPSRVLVSSASTTTNDPEAAAMERNGPLPSGTPNKYGMATNATSYPESNVQAMSNNDEIRTATQQEIDELKFYTYLSANSYCRTVIPGGKWDCPHCDKTADLKIIKTWSTTVYDTNALVARGDSQKTIYVAFRGSNSIRNWIAVSHLTVTNSIYLVNSLNIIWTI